MKGMKILILCAFVALASARSYGWGRNEKKAETAQPVYGPSQYYSASSAPAPTSYSHPQRKPEPTLYRGHPMEARQPYAVPSYAQAQAQRAQTTPAPAPVSAYHPQYVEQAYGNAPARARVQATAAPVEETVRISYGTELTGHHAAVITPAPVVSSFGPKAQLEVSRQNYYSAPHVPAPQPESNELRSEVHPHHPVLPKEVEGHPAVHNVQTEVKESTAVHTVQTKHNGQKAVHIIHTQDNATGHPVVVHKETHMLPVQVEKHVSAPPAPIHPTSNVHHTTALPLPVPIPAVRSSPPAPAPFVPTLRFEEEMREGSYHSYEFEAANRIHQKENTTIELLPEDHPLRAHNHGYETDDCDDGHGTALITKTGSYSYISPEGKHIQVSYIADKDGFRPVSDSIPTPPAPPHEAERAAHADAHHRALVAAEGAPEVEENEEAAQAAHLEHEAHAIHAARIAHAEHAARNAHAEHAARNAHAEHAARNAYAEHAAPTAHAEHAVRAAHAAYRSVM